MGVKLVLTPKGFLKNFLKVIFNPTKILVCFIHQEYADVWKTYKNTS